MLNNTNYNLICRLRRIAADISEINKRQDVLSAIKSIYDIEVDPKSPPECIRMLSESLQRLNPELVKGCGIKSMAFEDMGPSKEYFPNHGKYINHTLVLNEQLLEDPRIIVDLEHGVILNKFDQTFYHELGHGWDENNGEGTELSLKADWVDLSGWSKYPKPGLKRVRIHEDGAPEVVGEYYYSPNARFTRFYAKRNPWDDWADSFSYYVGNAKSYLPGNKIKYFEKVLSKYGKGDKS
jgi:hypothetical protein